MTNPLAGERIRAVRDLLGLSQKELATAIGFPQPRISEVERGLVSASDELLNAVSRATATPRAFFDASAPDLSGGTLRYRKRAGARAGDTDQANALLTEAYRVVATVLRSVDYPEPTLPQVVDNPTDDDIEELAVECRDALGIGQDGPIQNITRACERAGAAVVPLTLPGTARGHEDAVGHYGASCWPGRPDPALIGFFAGMAGDMQRFTLAHELGHLVLHSRRRTPPDAEREANRFAGAFLVPRSRAQELFADRPLTLRDFAHLKAVWGVSIQACIMRGSQLGYLDERRKTSLFKQLSARGWRRNEPVTVHPEGPELVWRALRRRYGTDGMYARAADDLGLPTLILRGLAPAPSAGAR